MSNKGSCSSGNFVKALPHALLDNEICLTGFIFERHQYDASCGAGALAQENQSCYANELAVFHLAQRCCWYHVTIIELGSIKRNRMRLERQANSLVVGRDLFSFIHRDQRHKWLILVSSVKQWPILPAAA